MLRIQAPVVPAGLFLDPPLTITESSGSKASTLGLHNGEMKCPTCQPDNFSKKGHRRGVQCYICKDCRKQFLDYYTPQGYSEKVKRNCLTMYLNGMGFRGIERTTGVCHNTVINLVKQAALALPDPPQTKKIPTVAQLDELQTFVQRKKQALGLDSGR